MVSLSTRGTSDVFTLFVLVLTGGVFEVTLVVVHLYSYSTLDEFANTATRSILESVQRAQRALQISLSSSGYLRMRCTGLMSSEGTSMMRFESPFALSACMRSMPRAKYRCSASWFEHCESQWPRHEHEHEYKHMSVREWN